ncbi:MAG: DUF368 domain-containing protein [Weeksellaceae bacterium]|nr:DUF368 domain-containing protein [Weeksellaceae bacterium]
MYKRRFVDYIILWLKGLAMGTANKVPGISGGMIALVTGFYEELIYSFQKVNLKAFNLLLNGRFRQFVQYINLDFLFAINFGSVSAFFSISLLIDWFMRSRAEGGLGLETEVWSYFFGLIIGSVIYVYYKIGKWTRPEIFGVLAGSALGLYISFIDPMAPNDSYWFIFLCGIISVSGMTLPGFSGSFILIILGNYNLLLVDSVNNLFYTILALFQGDFQMLGTETLAERSERIRMLAVVAVFAIGSVAGLVSFSKLMGYLLRRWHDIVLAWLMGFIIGSLGAAWPWKTRDVDVYGQLIGYTRYMPEHLDTPRFWLQILSIIAGILSILVFIYFEKKNNRV